MITAANESYQRLIGSLEEIERVVNIGIMSGDGHRACLSAKTLVYDARRILRDDFSVDLEPDFPDFLGA